jgi:hypothetical protein
MFSVGTDGVEAVAELALPTVAGERDEIAIGGPPRLPIRVGVVRQTPEVAASAAMV